MENNCIFLFMKPPVPGLVKTRLAKDLGNEKACIVYKSIAEKTLKEIKKTGVNFEVHFFPENGLNKIRSWLGSDIKTVAQQGKDLGDKMKNAFSCGFEKGYEKIIILGSDIPEINCEIINKAFKNIDNKPVIGPCEDGGYYLIGFDAYSFDESFFTEIKWSSALVFDQTVKKMSDLNLCPAFLQTLNDIDDINDFNKYSSDNKFLNTIK
ncbi:MAG: TIGR04282 family arsenosugar biosynthesis glycosyltransferase [Thermodesulfobacteriota bacterium]